MFTSVTDIFVFLHKRYFRPFQVNMFPLCSKKSYSADVGRLYWPHFIRHLFGLTVIFVPRGLKRFELAVAPKHNR